MKSLGNWAALINELAPMIVQIVQIVQTKTKHLLVPVQAQVQLLAQQLVLQLALQLTLLPALVQDSSPYRILFYKFLSDFQTNLWKQRGDMLQTFPDEIILRTDPKYIFLFPA